MASETKKSIEKEKNSIKIILGSQSEGRKNVLKEMGYKFDIMPADIDEKSIRFDDPVKLTLALANAKADALLTKIKELVILITSDQVVVCGGQIIEKPGNEKEAMEYLRRYSEYPAETVTSVVVVNTATGNRVEGTDVAKIQFLPIPDDVIEKYISSEDPFSHAGGFDHKNPMLLPYVDKLEGESESITGLPRRLTEELIERVR